MKLAIIGVAARGGNEKLPNLPDRPDFTGATPIEVKPGESKPDLTEVKQTDTAVDEARDPSGWTDSKEQLWLNAVVSDWVNPGLTAALYDESGQVLSYRRSGNPRTHEEIVWFGNMPIARFTSSGSTISAVHIIHTDHLNSPRALSNARLQGGQAAGTTLWTWDLLAASSNGSNAFGSQLAQEDVDANGTAVTFDLRFPGQQYDAETGLNYNYFRDYEAATGRYVESDPIGLRVGISTFTYANNSPLRFFDLDGLTASCGCDFKKEGSCFSICTNEHDCLTCCKDRHKRRCTEIRSTWFGWFKSCAPNYTKQNICINSCFATPSKPGEEEF